jgi:hypothetical protein
MKQGAAPLCAGVYLVSLWSLESKAGDKVGVVSLGGLSPYG